MINVTDWMSTKIITIGKDKSVYEAVELMEKFNVGAVIAVDSKQNPVGILTERDIMFKIVLNGINSQNITVSDIMSKKLITAKKECTVMDICKMMYKFGLRRMPITDDGKITGIITSMDIIHLMSV